MPVSFSKYNSQYLFQNPALAGILPQFDKNERLKNVYSFADTEKRVKTYLKNALGATESAGDGLIVKGHHSTVMRRISQLVPLIEAFTNNIPKIVQSLRKNTSFYLPFVTKKQIEEIKTYGDKKKILKAVLDNVQYNAEFGALNSIKKEPSAQFERNKTAWEVKVGHSSARRLKRI